MGNYIPKVSVIIPCYNGAKWICDTINSVLNQTYQDFELIVVDDGSIDNSKRIIDHYLSNERVTYIQHKENKGIPATRNTGIRASKGQYVAFLDQDDLWLPKKLEKQVRLFEKDKDGKIGLVFTDLLYFDSRGRTFEGTWPDRTVARLLSTKSKKDTLIQLFKENFISTPTAVMIRNKECFERLGLLNEELYSADDFEFWLRIAGNFKIEYIDKHLIKKRLHENNTYEKYAKEGKIYQDLITVTNDSVKRYPFLNKFRDRKLGRFHYLYGRCLFNNNQAVKARREFLKTLYYNPLHWRAFVFYVLAFSGKFSQSLYSKLKTLKRRLGKQ